MWDPSLSTVTTACALQVGRLFLSTSLLLTILPRYGAQVANAMSVTITHDVVDEASCEKNAASAIVEEAPASGPSWDGFVEAAGSKKDAAQAVLSELAPEKPTILMTAGNAIGGLVGTAKDKGSRFSDVVVRSGTSAWNALGESDLAALLNSTVHWAAYEDVMTDYPELKSTAGPVVEFATGLNSNGDIATRDILINTALLAVPAGKLGPILGKGAMKAVKIGPDVVILVDNVVVARIIGGAKRATGAVEGRIDDLGRVVQSLPPLQKVPLQDLPDRVRRVAIDQLKKQRSGRSPESGIYLANVGSHLPAQPSGYYREYPVDDPDSPNGGLQWLVIGENGELYFTEDCGNSFVEISLAADSPNTSDKPVEAGLPG